MHGVPSRPLLAPSSSTRRIIAESKQHVVPQGTIAINQGLLSKVNPHWFQHKPSATEIFQGKVFRRIDAPGVTP
jgi:hypothetical protein